MEVYAFDASALPATLTQITDRAQGTTGAAISRDGATVYWFDDSSGDELGRWVATSVSDVTTSQVLLTELDLAYPGGFVGLTGGAALVGRTVGDGLELARVEVDGSGRVVYRSTSTAAIVDATADGALALLQFDPDGDFLHPGVRVVRVADGVVQAELRQELVSISPVAFHPADSDVVLVTHERYDRPMPMLWNTATGEERDVTTGLEGDVTATWYPDGDALLVSVLADARHRTYRLDLATNALTPIDLPAGYVVRSSARADGSVHALMSRSDLPVSLLTVRGEDVERVIELPGEPPAETVAATDVYAEGPGGRVHGLLYLPSGGAGPHPTVFFVHGGPTGQDYDAWNDIVAAVVDAGYAVVRVNYRGSTGYGAQWRDALTGRLGFIELEDVGAIRASLEAAGVIDPGAVAIMGGSWGGYLTLMALGTEPGRWRCGAALVPLADWLMSLEDNPAWMVAADAALMHGTAEEIPDAYRAASPITYVDAVVAPVFVTAGENDPRCPVRQVDAYVERLRARGHDVRYDRLDTGHALHDLDAKVAEIGGVLEFFAETMPVG